MQYEQHDQCACGDLYGSSGEFWKWLDDDDLPRGSDDDQCTCGNLYCLSR